MSVLERWGPGIVAIHTARSVPTVVGACPTATVIADHADCGAVWGERFVAGCPHHTKLFVHLSTVSFFLDSLALAGVRHRVVTEANDYSIVIGCTGDTARSAWVTCPNHS